jgi:hypothetical protein
MFGPVPPIGEDRVQRSKAEASQDPIRNGWLQSDRFNRSWWKNGQRLNWPQRIAFALISFAAFSFGLSSATLGAHSLVTAEFFSWDTVGGVCWLLFGLVFLIPGCLGLRNVLRF